MYNKLKINLILSGTHAPSLSYIGALKYIIDNNNIEIKRLITTSMTGVLACVFLSTSIKETINIIKETKFTSLNSIKDLLYYKFILNKKIKDIIENIDFAKIKIPMTLYCTDVKNQKVIYYNDNEDLKDNIINCINLPLLNKSTDLYDGIFSGTNFEENLSYCDYNVLIESKIYKPKNSKLKFINLISNLYNKNPSRSDIFQEKINLENYCTNIFDYSNIENNIKAGYISTKKYFEEKILKYL